MKLHAPLAGTAILGLLSLIWCKETPFNNPVLPGWHSDPSCTFVEEWGMTVFCTTSSFLTFPGCPVFASKDFVNWRLVSHALSRNDQIPAMLSSTSNQMEGTFASTLRYHEDTFYLITSYVSWTDFQPVFLLFKTKNPYTGQWEGPFPIPNPEYKIDPDLFWDDDGTAYIASSSNYLQKVNLDTGESSAQVNIWNGTGERDPEGPHLYKKDSWYYLLAAEGGTDMNHSVMIARSKDIYGPYESYALNPILTNRNSNEYFQTVGHADLFKDAFNNWWGVALSTRSGPQHQTYPMGREAVLFPVTWDRGAWPELSRVRGHMSGPLPPVNKNVPGLGYWVDSGDWEDFAPGSNIPLHFIHWRPPPNRVADYAISPGFHRNTLALKASRANLTTDAAYKPTEGQTFVGRLQSHTLFKFSVDLSFLPTQQLQEAGITAFLTNYQHIDLSILGVKAQNGTLQPYIQLRTEASGKPDSTAPDKVRVPLPYGWAGKTLRLQIIAKNDREYDFSASLSTKPQDSKLLGSVGADLVSGGSGPFTGALLGAFATTNGVNGTQYQAYFSRWRYIPIGQKIQN